MSERLENWGFALVMAPSFWKEVPQTTTMSGFASMAAARAVAEAILKSANAVTETTMNHEVRYFRMDVKP